MISRYRYFIFFFTISSFFNMGVMAMGIGVEAAVEDSIAYAI